MSAITISAVSALKAKFQGLRNLQFEWWFVELGKIESSVSRAVSVSSRLC